MNILKTAMGCLLPILLMVIGCSGKNLHFGTYTELDVAGVEAKPTGEVALKIGYDRGEVAYVPDDGKDGYSVLGTFDSDVRLFSGYYINEKFATGEAANIAAKEIAGIKGNDIECNSGTAAKKTNPLFLTTGTRFGFHTRFSTAAGATTATPFEVLLGYKRANYAIVPINEETDAARSTYADIVIGEGSRRARAAEETNVSTDSPGNSPFGEGIIIKQSIATGCAAKYLAKKDTIQDKLMPLNSLKENNNLTADIETEMNRVSVEASLFDKAKDKLVALADGKIKKEDLKTVQDFIQDMQRTLTIKKKKTLLDYLKSLN